MTEIDRAAGEPRGAEVDPAAGELGAVEADRAAGKLTPSKLAVPPEKSAPKKLTLPFDGNSWSPNVRIPNQQSWASPALALYGGLLHMVHLGDRSTDIWHSTSDGGS